MKFNISTKHISYEFEIFGKYNILSGNSGSGKSVLHELIEEKNAGSRRIKVKLTDSDVDVPIYAVSRLDSNLSMHKDKTGCLLVIDENALIFKQRNAASLFQNSNNYFLLITRKNLDYLPISVENIYHIETIGSRNIFVHSYTLGNIRDFGHQDIIITEDENSGKKIFEEFFDIVVDSAESKSKLVDKILSLDSKYKNILAVYNAAAFGMQIKSFNQMLLKSKRNISVLDWQSFENHVLSLDPFNTIVDQTMMNYQIESLEQYSTNLLSSLINWTVKSSWLI